MAKTNHFSAGTAQELSDRLLTIKATSGSKDTH